MIYQEKKFKRLKLLFLALCIGRQNSLSMYRDPNIVHNQSSIKKEDRFFHSNRTNIDSGKIEDKDLNKAIDHFKSIIEETEEENQMNTTTAGVSRLEGNREREITPGYSSTSHSTAFNSTFLPQEAETTYIERTNNNPQNTSEIKRRSHLSNLSIIKEDNQENEMSAVNRGKDLERRQKNNSDVQRSNLPQSNLPKNKEITITPLDGEQSVPGKITNKNIEQNFKKSELESEFEVLMTKIEEAKATKEQQLKQNEGDEVVKSLISENADKQIKLLEQEVKKIYQELEKEKKNIEREEDIENITKISREILFSRAELKDIEVKINELSKAVDYLKLHQSRELEIKINEEQIIDLQKKKEEIKAFLYKKEEYVVRILKNADIFADTDRENKLPNTIARPPIMIKIKNPIQTKDVEFKNSKTVKDIFVKLFGLPKGESLYAFANGESNMSPVSSSDLLTAQLTLEFIIKILIEPMEKTREIIDELVMKKLTLEKTEENMNQNIINMQEIYKDIVSTYNELNLYFNESSIDAKYQNIFRRIAQMMRNQHYGDYSYDDNEARIIGEEGINSQATNNQSNLQIITNFKEDYLLRLGPDALDRFALDRFALDRFGSRESWSAEEMQKLVENATTEEFYNDQTFIKMLELFTKLVNQKNKFVSLNQENIQSASGYKTLSETYDELLRALNILNTANGVQAAVSTSVLQNLEDLEAIIAITLGNITKTQSHDTKVEMNESEKKKNAVVKSIVKEVAGIIKTHKAFFTELVSMNNYNYDEIMDTITKKIKDDLSMVNDASSKTTQELGDALKNNQLFIGARELADEISTASIGLNNGITKLTKKLSSPEDKSCDDLEIAGNGLSLIVSYRKKPVGAKDSKENKGLITKEELGLGALFLLGTAGSVYAVTQKSKAEELVIESQATAAAA